MKLYHFAFCARGCNPVTLKVTEQAATKLTSDAQASGWVRVVGSDGQWVEIRWDEVAWFSLEEVKT